MTQIPLREFYEKPEISKFFPLKFESGQRWTEFTGHCFECDRLIKGSNLRGSVSETFRGVHILDAMGYCPECNLLTPYRYRLYADGISGRTKTGEWARWDTEYKYTIWQRIVRFLGLKP
jgi:hypothetical protein